LASPSLRAPPQPLVGAEHIGALPSRVKLSSACSRTGQDSRRRVLLLHQRLEALQNAAGSLDV